MESTIAIIGQLKNKKTGLGKALNDFTRFVKSSKKIKYDEIDITDNYKIFYNIFRLIKSKARVYYFTPSGSLLGNIRDSILLFVMISKKKPIVLHFHNSNFGNTISKSRLLIRLNAWLYKRITCIIVLGEKQKRQFSVLKLENERFVIIRNGVDEDIFIDDELLEKKLSSPITKVVYFSNMIPSKGYEFVYEITKQFHNDSSVQFVFSGKFFNEHLESEFLSKIESTNIIYYNGVYGKEKIKLLQSTNIFILPSQYPDETLPISMLEAMAAGNYIFITDVGVVSEVVIPETTTFIREFNAKEVAEQIREVVKKLPYLDYKITDLKNNYSNQSVQSQILSVINQVIEKESENV